MNKKILLLGGTGAMGVYLTPILVEMGYMIDVVSLDTVENENRFVRYITADGRDIGVLRDLLANSYDAIVDFLIYPESCCPFGKVSNLFLESTDHYIYLSTYRVYADEHPITEDSPRLLDASTDASFLATDDYALYKAKGEDILRASVHRNWTAIRPAITYSKRRFQLVTLEANAWLERARTGKTVLLPESAMNHEACMSWGGDVAKMIARLLLNSSALGEFYTVSTSEHHTWREIAEYYRDLIGLNYKVVDDEAYLSCVSVNMSYDRCRYQLIYDRCFDRVIDNTKILRATGMKQEELMPLYDGLHRELSALPSTPVFGKNAVSEQMDIILKQLKGI